ncbi:MAG: hypothetical protein FD123_1290 [Bacteroidetes bacterium]|nr:MAG: hypothetical protein FD123_1290 [Bacteroidota bacterium]
MSSLRHSFLSVFLAVACICSGQNPVMTWHEPVSGSFADAQLLGINKGYTYMWIGKQIRVYETESFKLNHTINLPQAANDWRYVSYQVFLGRKGLLSLVEHRSKQETTCYVQVYTPESGQWLITEEIRAGAGSKIDYVFSEDSTNILLTLHEKKQAGFRFFVISQQQGKIIFEGKESADVADMLVTNAGHACFLQSEISYGMFREKGTGHALICHNSKTNKRQEFPVSGLHSEQISKPVFTGDRSGNVIIAGLWFTTVKSNGFKLNRIEGSFFMKLNMDLEVIKSNRINVLPSRAETDTINPAIFKTHFISGTGDGGVFVVYEQFVSSKHNYTLTDSRDTCKETVVHRTKNNYYNLFAMCLDAEGGIRFTKLIAKRQFYANGSNMEHTRSDCSQGFLISLLDPGYERTTSYGEQEGRLMSFGCFRSGSDFYLLFNDKAYFDSDPPAAPRILVPGWDNDGYMPGILEIPATK